MKNISIPKPCSENWNEMSPTERGAFCQKCAIDVHDFTNKSGDEIRDILTLNIGSRVCGRIEPRQLKELNDDFAAWKLSNSQSFNRAWIFSLLVVFGLTLFSCEEDEEPVVKEIQKTAQSFMTNLPEKDGLVDETIESTTTGEVQLPSRIGKNDDSNPPDTVELSVDLDEIQVDSKLSRNTDYELGELAFVEVIECGIRGDIAVSPAYVEYLTESDSSPQNEIKFSGITYPNPASNQTTLKVTLPQKGKTEIQLVSMNGQVLRTIHSGRLSKGESEFLVDLTDLEVGTYLFVIYSSGEKETVKFSKI